MLLIFGQVFAQNKTPQSPDPKTIFVSGVEVVETYSNLKYDNKVRVINYYDPTALEWKSYPYPADLKDDVVSDFSYGKEEYLLLTRFWEWYRSFSDYRDIGAEYFWVFDAASGTFSQPAQQCGRVQAKPNKGIWVAYTGQAGQVFCNTETSETTQPLPKTFDADTPCLTSFYNNQPTTSPDGKWLVFHTCPPDPKIYSYELDTGKIIQLGIATDLTEVGIHSWFDNSNIIFYLDDQRRTSQTQVHTADITQADSLTYIASNPQYNALKFYWKRLKGDSGSGTASLEIHSYDMVTQKSTQLLEYDCEKTSYSCMDGITLVNKAETRVAIVDAPPDVLVEGLAIYDIASQKLIYEINASVATEGQIAWADDDTLIYLDERFDRTDLHIVKFSDSAVTSDRIIKDGFESYIETFLSPDGKLLVLVNHNRIELESVSTGQAKIIAQIDDEKASFRAVWDDQNLLYVSLHCCASPSEYSWQVQIPDGILAND